MDLETIKAQHKEIEELEQQVDEAIPLVQMLWKKYIGYESDVPINFQVAIWVGMGDLHAIRNAIIQVGVRHANDEQSEDAESLVAEIDDLISAKA